MDLLLCALCSTCETRVTPTLEGNEKGIEAERVCNVTKEEDQEGRTRTVIKTEPKEICVPVVQMTSTSISYKRRKNMCSEISVTAREPRSLDDLPDEILLKILSHFGPNDLGLVIANVCVRWKGLAKDVTLWKTLTYSCDRSSDISHITEVLTAAPALHSLIIFKREDAADILKFLFHKHVDLRKLILKDCCLGEESTDLLANFVDLYPDLQVLSLKRCYPIYYAGYHLISRLKKLSELKLYDDEDSQEEFQHDTVRLIADSCQHLKKLSLYGVRNFDNDDIIHVINNLGKQLTTLVLNAEDLTDVGYSYFKNCARLQELEVNNCENMTDRGLLEGIGSLHELTSLSLIGIYNLTAQALSTFLHRPSITSIVLLKLWVCSNLDDEGMKGIAERCIHLKELDISWCRNVTDAGMSMVISHCSQLCVLQLVGLSSITGKGYLALVPSHMRHLRRLCLKWCPNVCCKSVEDLVDAVPELTVFLLNT